MSECVCVPGAEKQKKEQKGHVQQHGMENSQPCTHTSALSGRYRVVVVVGLSRHTDHTYHVESFSLSLTLSLSDDGKLFQTSVRRPDEHNFLSPSQFLLHAQLQATLQ